jgi:hypothetical protein
VVTPCRPTGPAAPLAGRVGVDAVRAGHAAIAAVAWSDHLLRQAGRPDLVQLDLDAAPPVLAVVSAGTVGAVLASRRPRHPVGWLLLAFVLCLVATAAAAQYLVYGLLVRPGALPAARYAARYYPATVFTALALLGFVLLLTPTGSLPSPRWRWWARVMVATPVVLLVVVTLAPAPLHPRSQAVGSPGSPFDLRRLSGVVLVANQVALAVTLLGVLVAAGSLVVRFRRARGIERLQLRWVAVAAALVSLAGAAILAGLAAGVPGLRACSAGQPVSAWQCCRWRSARRSCATGCTTWTASSAVPWPTGCSRCCWAAATLAWSWRWAGCLAKAPAWRCGPPPGRWTPGLCGGGRW